MTQKKVLKEKKFSPRFSGEFEADFNLGNNL